MLASPFMRLRSLSACFAVLTTLLQAACGTVNQGPTMAKTPPSRAADEVAVWMMGNYSSSAQAKSDPENFKRVVLDEAAIDGQGKPLLVYADEADQQPPATSASVRDAAA